MKNEVNVLTMSERERERAVSYTHLDVYKRQVYKRVLNKNKYINITSVNIQLTFLILIFS